MSLKPDRLLQTHSTFSKSVMVSMAVSKLGPVDLILANVNSSVRLSFVTFVHPTQPVEFFGNVSTPCGSLAIR